MRTTAICLCSIRSSVTIQFIDTKLESRILIQTEVCGVLMCRISDNPGFRYFVVREQGLPDFVGSDLIAAIGQIIRAVVDSRMMRRCRAGQGHVNAVNARL